MEVSALKYSGGIGLHGRSPLLRLQSDERLVVLVRRGNVAAFEQLVSRYESRLLAFCRHMLGSREDAEDVLQDVLASAYNAMLADERPINVRPWLYRIARNRSLNHMRRARAIGVDSMDIHLSDHGATTADKVYERETFRLLVGDIHGLPETQRTALVLREMDALSYEQIADAMETTVPSVKSLLVRARVSLAEAAEARLLTCDEVRLELGEVAEGLLRKPSAPVRRHLKSCPRCETFQSQMQNTNKALALLLPVGPLVLLRKLLLVHAGHSAGAAGSSLSAGGAATSGSGVVAAGATGTSIVGGSGAAAAGAVSAGAATSTGSIISAGVGALATKAAAGLAAAALVTAGAVEVGHHVKIHAPLSPAVIAARQAAAAGPVSAGVAAATARPAIAGAIKVARLNGGTGGSSATGALGRHRARSRHERRKRETAVATTRTTAATTTGATITSTTPTTTTTPTTLTPTTPTSTTLVTTVGATDTTPITATTPGRTAVTVAPTDLPPADAGTPAPGATTTLGLTPTTSSATTPVSTMPSTTTPTSVTPTTTATSTTPTTTTPTTPTTTTPTTTTPNTPTTTTPTTTTPTTTSTTTTSTTTTSTTTTTSSTPTNTTATPSTNVSAGSAP